MKAGKPLSGGAGDILRRMATRGKIGPKEYFTTHVVHIPAEKGNFASFYRKSKQMELVKGILQLKQDILDIKPNIIIALGGDVLKILTGKTGIDKWRGSILPAALVPGVKVIGTYHPSYILKVYDYKAICEFDLTRAGKQSAFPEINYPARTFYLPNGTVTRRDGTDWITTEEAYDVEALIEDMLQAEYLSVDIECQPTAVGTWELVCIGFSDRPDRALVLNTNTGLTRAQMKRICEHPIKKVMQNGSFDTTVLREEGVICKNFVWDTMLAHHTLFAECASGGDELAVHAGKKRQSAFAKGLGFQTSIYTLEPFYKDDGKLWKVDGDINTFYRYNALDCAVTKEIQEVQVDELKAHPGGVQQFNHAMDLVEPVLHATRIGLRVDLEVRDALIKKYTEEIDRLQAALDIFAGGPINVKSTNDVQTLLYDKLKLPVQYAKRKQSDGSYKKTPSADKDALNLLAAKTSNPTLLLILKIRERRDLLERYLYVQLDHDNRMRSSVDITGSRTGRLSYRATLSGSGTNLQNQPEELRVIYIADPDYLLVYSDYSQAEARLVAHYAHCRGLIELFDDPSRDIHKENAARIFGKDIKDVTPEERYLAKRVVHASNYGMDAPRLVQIVNQDAETTGIRITLQMAEFLLLSYFTIYPEIKDIFWRGVENELNATKQLINPFGWGRTFYGRTNTPQGRNQAYAHKPQSGIGILCRQAWINTDRLLKPLGGDVLVNVHDALLSRIKIDKLDESIEAIRQGMDIPITVEGSTIKIPIDFQIGYNWGHKGKDGSNPRGLQSIADWKKEFAT